MKLNLLFGAGVKLGGAAVCGFCAGALALVAGRAPGGTDGTTAVLIAGLGGSSLILAGQAASDVISIFRPNKEQT